MLNVMTLPVLVKQLSPKLATRGLSLLRASGRRMPLSATAQRFRRAGTIYGEKINVDFVQARCEFHQNTLTAVLAARTLINDSASDKTSAVVCKKEYGLPPVEAPVQLDVVGI